MEIEYVQFYDGKKMGIKAFPGGVVIPAIYDFVASFSDGLFNVTQGNTHAYFNDAGEVVLPFENRYESYGDFTEGLARVRVNELWGYIDKSGKEIIKPQFHYADVFSDGFAVVRNTADKHGAIDKTGKIIIDYQYRVLRNFENGYARFGDYKTYGLLDISGKIVIPKEYISIGKIEKNKVTVQILEDGKYKEGIFTLGGTVEWNNNLDKLNASILKRKEFTTDCEQMIKEMYTDGCPCAYQRFRSFIQWDKPINFMDHEEIFYLFSKYLEKVSSNSFSCKICTTTYEQKREEYSISLQVINVKITKIGTFVEKGAIVIFPIPVSLGFRGHDLNGLKNTYVQTDNETVINYLKEKLDPNTSIAKRSWLQRFFSSN